MIFFYLLFLLLGVIAYVVVTELGLPGKLLIALLVFLLPSLALTLWLLIVGDRPPDDAVTVAPESSMPKRSDSEGSASSKR